LLLTNAVVNLSIWSFVIHVLAEIEELSGRLKASRQRVADLERNFTTASNSSQKNEKVSLSCNGCCIFILPPHYHLNTWT